MPEVPIAAPSVPSKPSVPPAEALLPHQQRITAPADFALHTLDPAGLVRPAASIPLVPPAENAPIRIVRDLAPAVSSLGQAVQGKPASPPPATGGSGVMPPRPTTGPLRTQALTGNVPAHSADRTEQTRLPRQKPRVIREVLSPHTMSSRHDVSPVAPHHFPALPTPPMPVPPAPAGDGHGSGTVALGTSWPSADWPHLPRSGTAGPDGRTLMPPNPVSQPGTTPD